MKYTRLNVLRRLLKYIRVPVCLMILRSLISVLSSLISMVQPYINKILVDEVMTEGQIKLLLYIIPALVILHIFTAVTSYWGMITSNRFSYGITLTVKRKIFEKILARDISQARSFDVGIMTNNIKKDSGTVSAFLWSHVAGRIVSAVTGSVYFCLMLSISLPLTVLSVTVLPVCYMVSKFIGKNFDKVVSKRHIVSAELSTYMFDSVRNWKDIKCNTLESDSCDIYTTKISPEKELNSSWMKYFSLENFFYKIKGSFVMQVMMYFAGGLLILYDKLSLGDVLMFMSYMGAFSGIFDGFMYQISDFLSQKSVFDRLFSIFEEPEYVAKKDFPNDTDIILDKVNFTYDTAEYQVLTDVCCMFEYGKKYLVTGKSGAGKSTLARILLGLNAPNSGVLSAGGIAYDEIDSGSRMKHIGAVTQDNMFFNLSIRENLTFVKPDATENELYEALRSASLEEFVESLPLKLDTIIGERGVKLSGGQKQRLAMARLILHAPQIVILDEPSSALDSISENEVFDGVYTHFRDNTIIVISHKPLAGYKHDTVLRVQTGGKVSLK